MEPKLGEARSSAEGEMCRRSAEKEGSASKGKLRKGELRKRDMVRGEIGIGRKPDGERLQIRGRSDEGWADWRQI